MATLTRADVEREVANIAGPVMELAGLLGGVFDGTNPALNAAIRDGLERMGYSIADPAGLTVADADLAVLSPLALRRLMEWTMLNVLEQVDQRWVFVEMHRPKSLEMRSTNGVTTDPLQGIKARILAQISHLRDVVKTPYQSMNVPIAVGQIAIGSRSDRSLPPSVVDVIPPWALAPDGLRFFGCGASELWGGDFP